MERSPWQHTPATDKKLLNYGLGMEMETTNYFDIVSAYPTCVYTSWLCPGQSGHDKGLARVA